MKFGSKSYAYTTIKYLVPMLKRENIEKESIHDFPTNVTFRDYPLHPLQRPFFEEILSLRCNFTIYNDDIISASCERIENSTDTFSGSESFPNTSVRYLLSLLHISHIDSIRCTIATFVKVYVTACN